MGEKSHSDRAFELIVYAPIGAAMYVRDMTPSMLGIFVARGKREVASHRVPEPPPVPVPTPTEVRQKMEEGFGMAAGAAGAAAGAAAGGVGLARDVAVGGVGLARDVAGSALTGFLQRRGAPAPGPATDAAPAATARPPAPTPASEPAPGSPNGAPAPAVDVPSVDDLPIPDYDQLSASQVVERLAGLDHDSLDRIRRYESAHRARNTILGKIAQLG